MEKKHTKLGKISLILSIIGIIGGFLTLIMTGNKVNLVAFAGVDLSLLLGIIAMILGGYCRLKEKEKYGSYALIIGFISLFINGFLLMMGSMSAMP